MRTLWQAFEVSQAGADGETAPLPDGHDFLHDTIMHHRGMADIVLRPREGMPMPSLPELSWPEAALTVLRAAHADVDGLRAGHTAVGQ